MNLRRKNRLMLVMVVLAGLGLATALVMYALRSNIDLFYTLGEVVYGKGETQVKPEPGQRLRIGGMVMPGSVKRDPETLKVAFQLYDNSAVINVSYEGILPDLFREGQGVVAQGALQDRTHIIAKEVLARHDEKYTPAEISDAMKKNHTHPSANDKSGGQS